MTNKLGWSREIGRCRHLVSGVVAAWVVAFLRFGLSALALSLCLFMGGAVVLLRQFSLNRDPQDAAKNQSAAEQLQS